MPASFWRTVAQASQDGNYVGLIATIVSFFLLVLSIVYAQRGKFHLIKPRNSPAEQGDLNKSAYLPFKVNSSGVMPIIFLALPGTHLRFTGLGALKNAAATLNPGAFFNYYHTFLQLDPDDAVNS
ncbi:preprotein translocase subunit SECY, chloroplastic-like isoform X2 [Olea europaea var. sylvestris]|uniref:preprotein translocase subunit SECY, chloroplastic-like isoform X2 n=1 Tax=Olea europaea var. sylvestris TaxID=158386 RepID=UPI000C1CF2A6|nr:preprotein translocase subunit SECY, chloroplastic-like isoform X2 [Olea europaea var. sylvestris]